MNLLDALLILTVVAATVGGFRVGFVARIASWIGIGIGLVLSTRTVPWMLYVVDDQVPAMRLIVGLGALVLTVSVCGAVFGSLGAIVRRTIASSPLSGIDRAGGAVAGAALVVGLAWLLLPAAADVPGTVSQQVRSSVLVATLDASTPDPPDAVRAFRRLIGSSPFPEVFADLAPSPDLGPPPDDLAVDASVLEHARASTALVQSDGCRRRFEGSSFVIAPGMMATNAHVVAGSNEVRVRFPDGDTHRAVVVVFDPERDLALLEVEGMDRPALPLATPDRSGEGAVIGYPGGQREPRIAPARVDGERRVLGRDIYGEAETERTVVFLAAALRQGDSGSPVIDTDGRVGGVVFAVSPDRADVAYALAVDEVEAALAAPWDPGHTGRCM